MQDKAFANPKIEFVWNSEVVDILDGGKGEVTGAMLRNMQTGERTELAWMACSWRSATCPTPSSSRASSS